MGKLQKGYEQVWRCEECGIGVILWTESEDDPLDVACPDCGELTYRESIEDE